VAKRRVEEVRVKQSNQIYFGRKSESSRVYTSSDTKCVGAIQQQQQVKTKPKSASYVLTNLLNAIIDMFPNVALASLLIAITLLVLFFLGLFLLTLGLNWITTSIKQIINYIYSTFYVIFQHIWVGN
jgi:hypothetical protein